MGVLYRILGVAALIGQRLSRTRINLVPINWAVMIGLFGLCLGAIAAASEGFANGDKPASVTLADIVAGRVNPSRNYVRVSGTIFPDAAFTSTYRSKYETDAQAQNKPASEAWVLFAAPDAKGLPSAIMVQRADASATTGEPYKTTVTGLLKPMDSDLQKEIDKLASEEKDLKINREYVLTENDKPGNGWLWATIAAASGMAWAALAFTFLTKYIVFQKQGLFTLPTPGPVSAATFDVPETIAHATAQFHFAERKTSQRFLNVPSLVTQTDQGEAALVANVDASRRFYVFTTDKRNGLWFVLLGRMAGHPAEKGTLYLGASARPALRVQTVASPDNGPSQTVILSTQTEAERDQLIAALVTPRTPRASDTASAANATPTGAGMPLPFDL